MCGIVGSFDLAKIQLGFEHIQQRGTKGYSLSVVTADGLMLYRKAYELKNTSLKDAIAEIPPYDFAGIIKLYYILHVQSPTGLVSKPHPAERSPECAYLWHNGMLNSPSYRKEADAEWDTQLLLDNIVEQGTTKALSRFEGSFACILATTYGLFCFRNAIAPLYYSPGGTLSSSNKFEGSVAIDKNKIFKLTTSEAGYDLSAVGSFSNSHNPFGV